MANIKSQIKRNLQNERHRQRNKAVRSEIKTRVKQAVSTAESGAENSAEALRLAVKRLDTAGAKGVIHKNQASNRKARLMRRLARLTATPPPTN
ncbi:MAG: 30S ribosomal protein S20 [Acidimicrobiales bacterium]